MSKYKQNFGKWGESEAEKYLLSKGYSILERNFRSSTGEIDLIAMDKDMLVFVEVKTRSSTKFGFPENAITKKKKESMIATAMDYYDANPDQDLDWRIDVISILINRNSGAKEIIHFENALYE